MLRFVSVVLVIAALALPGVARAHGGGNFTAGTTGAPPTLDGVVTASEWRDATPYTVTFGAFGNATVRFVRTATDLYVGAVVQDPTPGVTPSFDVFFDNDHDGVKEAGDDVWLSFVGASTGSDFFWNPTAPGPGGPSHYSDSTDGGTNETVAAGTGAAGAVSFELRHPLCSADTTHDICASTGQTLGVTFQYERGATPGDFVNAPGSNVLDPSANWANLALAAGDAVAPTVTVTQPAAGSLLSGTVAVAADASDNVGVAAVDFRYFGGALPYVELGTDTDPPYTASFDTTQVPNRAVGAGTVYAFARDAAGNTTAVGNAVGIDNTPPGRIVFETDRDGNSEIYSMNPDGTNLTRLTNSALVVDTRPSLSPDGSLIAWQSGGQVWLMNSDGTNKRALTSGGAEGAPTFSPDGTKIAFESDPAGDMQINYDIWVMNVDGTAQRNVTNAPGNDGSPTWSPDGTKLAFHSGPVDSEDIFTINADGTGRTNLTSASPGRDVDPDWSPDGQKLLFVSGRSGFTSVWSMNVDGTVARDVTSSRNFDADPAWSPDGSYIVFTRDNIGAITFNVWTARADGTGQLEITGARSTQRNSFADWGALALPATVTAASIAITGDSSALAGAASAAISGISIDAIRGATSGPSATPLGGIPLGGIPLGGIPLGGIPLGGIPLGGIPLGGIGFTSTNLDQNGLGGVPLSTIPLKSTTDTWQARLDANPAFKGTPPQSVTLAQVLGTSVVSTPTPVTLDAIDLAASPLGGIPLGGIALGGIPLGGIPLGGIATSTTSENLAAWCDFINQQPGFTCTDPNSLSGQTMIGIALQGVPLGGIPLGGIPLGGIDLASSPLGGIPLGGIDLGGTPLGGIPLGGIPLGGIDLASSPLGGIPLGGISTSTKTAILTCPTGSFTCPDTATLAEAFAAGAIKSTAKVEDIGYYCKPGAPASTACRAGETPILLRDFILNGLPPDATLEDLLGTILSEVAYDWESLPLPGFPIQDFSDDGGTITYTVSFSVAGSGRGVFPATIGVKIPEGARYVAGSAALSEGLTAPAPTLVSPANELVWPVAGVPLNTPQTLTFRVKPGLSLKTETATATISAASLPAVQAPAPATTTIRQTWEFFEGTPQIAKDRLYFGFTANGNDRDFFRLPVPAAGTQVTVRLSHLKLDDDLVVYGPVPPPLRQPKAATSVLQANDVPPDLQQRTQEVTPEVLADVPVNPPAGQGVLGISDNRGLADEEVTFIVPEDAGGYVNIQISSFDGSYSNEAWMLRVEESLPVPLPPGCKTPPLVGGGTTKAMPPSVGGSTLYLFNSKRYGDLYGSGAETTAWNKLQAMAARTDAAGGTVIPVDAIPAVATTLGAWQGNPCSPGRTNDVVRALGTYLDTVAAPYKYIVLVGDWTVLPPGLVLDNTSFANERGYASTFYGSENTQYLSSYALGYLPTDDPYGDTSYAGRGTYVPEVAVGRLVETPAEIEAQLDQYVARGGAIDPTTALVTGYDFLTDGAQQISTGLKANVGAPKELISDVWSKSDLLAALFPASNPPVIGSINAHYDHYRALPADENAANRESVLFTTADLQAMPGRLVITIGCHSGTPVSDFLAAGPLAQDWDQSYAAKGAIGYIAQSGYGLGETAGVGYSEQLHVLLAQRLDGSLTVGQALVFAKNEYTAIPLTGGYDLKVVNGAGLYGLPMYRIGTGVVPPPPAPLPLATDAATGLPAASFSLSPTFTKVTASTGSYYTVSGDASFQNRRPIEPFTKLDVTQPGYVAHGALLTAAVSSDQSNFDAAFSRAIEDRAAFSPELVGDVISPTRLQSIATFSTPTGPQQRLVISTGQFLADGIPDPLGLGTQRLFSSLGGVVLYAPLSATDFSSPTFGPVQAFATDVSTIGFAVDIDDSSGVDSVKRVVALYKDGSGAWRSVDLSHVAGSRRWSGGGPFTGSRAEWFLQAADASGNVGVISNKAQIDPVAPAAPTGGISASVSGLQTNGWYTGAADVTITGAPDITSSLDGAPFRAEPVVTVAGTGLHTVEYQSSNGARGTTIVPIDVTDPTVTIASPGILELGQTSNFGFFTCADAGSGIASCAVSGIDTSTPTLNGTTRSVTVTATDRVGRTSSATGAYRVLYAFRGFFQPVDNLPVVNSVKAGSAVPVKFSLGGNQGLNVFAAGYPQSVKIPCDAADAVADLETTVTASNSSLTYDSASGRYTYVWKTDKAWAGTCRRLVVRFADGAEYAANFKFK